MTPPYYNYAFILDDRREELGRIALPDDQAARAFGQQMIRDAMGEDAAYYAGASLEITRGDRSVANLPYEKE